MTPLQIRVLISIYQSPALWPDDGTDYATTQVLKEDGLIRLDDKNRFVITRKGHAHIHQLCLLPLPQEAYTGADGKLIEL